MLYKKSLKNECDSLIRLSRSIIGSKSRSGHMEVYQVRDSADPGLNLIFDLNGDFAYPLLNN